MSTTIPTIGLSPYLTAANSNDPQKATVIAAIREACQTTGFFRITHHGISPFLQSDLLTAAKHFFALPLATKRRYIDTTARKGYEEIGSQTLQQGTRPDIKESYMVGTELTAPKKPPYRPFEYPNIWPDASILPEAVFKEPILKYHEAICELARIIMEILLKGLEDDFPGLRSEKLLQDFCREPCASLRLLRYPGPSSRGDGEVVAGAHTDFGGITLLLQDGNEGLQVLYRQGRNEDQGIDGEREAEAWVDGPSTPDAYVVNIGDMFERWTGGRYRSTVHRVVNVCGRERYSVPFFYDGNLDFKVQPLDKKASLKGKGREVTVREYLMKKFEEIYL
ncbi:isopenicillin N synthase family dioxygenase [Aspergillus aculeatinus CBS 121060]|uniref:2OG-Fe(II) oxygenase family oxidoreductase n=1 Tax=Aspergillus aculeatinus CBS 121060 TaxID=1448322 RepID=A0ACD1HPY0_9EURO|nr:putative 2OG-Fe(II) oxygenase family oxidoreductase [Aspergillus aculeatinus CBS 121060]RAH75641.1 putative 2OG-Fe(II) oxygenase family oxidoreductase [Aspergillus aculeatinus CBS 121060]